MKKVFNEDKATRMVVKMGTNATETDIRNVAEKMNSMRKGPLVKVWDKVVQLWDALNSPHTPKSLRVIIIGGLIYMVSPVDLIPDVVPITGLLDDAGVIGIIFSQFVRFVGGFKVGEAIVTVINKVAIKQSGKKNLAVAFQNRNFADKFKEKIKNHKGLSFDELESWKYDDGTVNFSAKVTTKTDNEISIDILDSWNNIILADVQLKGEKIDNDIRVGTEILLYE